MSKRVYLDSVGCRLNQSEITMMERQFQALGYHIVAQPDEADLVVVNTCAVTRKAGKTSRQMIRQINRVNRQAEIVATGCYAHIAKDKVAALPGVIKVLDNFEKEQLVHTITGEVYELEPIERFHQPGGGGLTRGFVKVQDGCDNQCTFCITTIARGISRSRPIEAIIREVQMMAAGGYREIVLTGVNLGAYGYDFEEPTPLYDLVQALLAATDIPRIRLSSLEPWDLSEEFFQLWTNPRLCRHLHLPLQSGCDGTLRRMLRRTKQTEFRQLVEAARHIAPDIAISTDLIVGFPGETEEEFAASYAFTQAMDFMKIHVFPFSAREGTAAARIKGRVPQPTIKARLYQIQQLSDLSERRYYEQYLGTIQAVLWEGVRGASEAGFHNIGLTDNYIRVETYHPDVLTNQIMKTRFIELSPEGMRGEIATEGATIS